MTRRQCASKARGKYPGTNGMREYIKKELKNLHGRRPTCRYGHRSEALTDQMQEWARWRRATTLRHQAGGHGASFRRLALISVWQLISYVELIKYLCRYEYGTVRAQYSTAQHSTNSRQDTRRCVHSPRRPAGRRGGEEDGGGGHVSFEGILRTVLYA